MRQLPQKLRLRFNLSENDSSRSADVRFDSSRALNLPVCNRPRSRHSIIREENGRKWADS